MQVSVLIFAKKQYIICFNEKYVFVMIISKKRGLINDEN